ncbi:hypothetical protein FWH13_01030 [Candidatus Saccharibacteria bacterium]|nr:hypothetical protein [Candidatus Saccharibacteria bacterium]
MQIEKIYIGGWFQRTMLHLTEVYNLLKNGESFLKALDPDKLKKLQQSLDVKQLDYIVDGFERVEFTTEDDITVKIFEDGLIVLSGKPKDAKSMDAQITTLTKYYENVLSPAFSYIFSLGAPVPKELANIKTVYPYFIVLNDAKPKAMQKFMEGIDQQRYYSHTGKSFDILRGEKYYFINNKIKSEDRVEDYIEEQIFIREFKGQLHRYLDLHRIIWSQIAKLKEKQNIRGREIVEFSAELDDIAKTINLVDSRINQMGSYLRTREKLALKDPDFQDVLDVMEYRYEALANTLSYIQHVWKMTANYVADARSLFSGLQQEVTQRSVESLAVITSMGVGASLIALITTDTLPQFTTFGVLYFLALAGIGFAANWAMRTIGNRRRYTISDKDYTKID